MDKLRVYLVALLAFSPLLDKVNPGSRTYVEHLPALIPAESIEAAAENAKQFALDKRKKSAGWYGHQAAIMPVTKQFFDLALNALEAGAIDEETNEVETTFVFDE